MVTLLGRAGPPPSSKKSAMIEGEQLSVIGDACCRLGLEKTLLHTTDIMPMHIGMFLETLFENRLLSLYAGPF